MLDGFPRSMEQATALAGILADDPLDRAVIIDVPLEVARARLLAHRVCVGCGRIYSVERARGLETWTCGRCGDVVQRRGDDNEEAVTRRLALHDEQTQLLLDWFAEHDQLLMVNGVGTSEEVFTRLLAGLWPRIPADRIAQLAGVSEPVPTEPMSASECAPATWVTAVRPVSSLCRQARRVRYRGARSGSRSWRCRRRSAGRAAGRRGLAAEVRREPVPGNPARRRPAVPGRSLPGYRTGGTPFPCPGPRARPARPWSACRPPARRLSRAPRPAEAAGYGRRRRARGAAAPGHGLVHRSHPTAGI